MAVAARARRYAEAVAQIARDQGSWEQWVQQLSRLAALVQEPGVITVLESPRISLVHKREIVQRRLPDLDTATMNLVQLLLQRRRIDLLPDIVSELQRMYDEERGIVHARVISAVPLSAGEQAAVQRQLAGFTGKQVTIATEVDPSIIAGLVVRIGDKLLDGSARGRLDALRRQLAQRA